MKAVHLIAAWLAVSILLPVAVRAGSDSSCDPVTGPIYDLQYRYDPGIAQETAPAVPSAVSDPSLFVTSDIYDPPTNLLTGPGGGRVSSFTYDGANNVITSTVPAVQDGAYDFQDRQTSMMGSTTTHPGMTTMTTYDHSGQLIQSVTPPGGLAGEMKYTYDTNGNVLSHTAPDSHGIPTHYDDNTYSGSSSMTDALGHVTLYTYDGNNNLITQTEPSMGHLTTFTYDTMGNQISMTDAAGTTMYSTNQTNNSSHYDTTTSPGDVTRTMYDTLDRTTTMTDPLNRVTTYQYDAMDRQTRMTDAGPLGNTISVYDTLDRTSSMTDPLGHVTSYQYDSTYQSTQTPISGGGSTIQSMYDATGSMTDANGIVTQYMYDTTYDITRTPGPDGFTYQYTYDVLDRITTGNLPAVQYDFDMSGTLTPQTGSTPFAPQYQYDADYDYGGGGNTQAGSITAMLNVSFTPLPAALPGGLALMLILGAMRRFGKKAEG